MRLAVNSSWQWLLQRLFSHSESPSIYAPLTVDPPQRDQHVRDDTFDTAQFPFAVFTVAQAQIFSGSYGAGQNVKFSLDGQLTLHGITHPVTFTMQGKRQADAITGSGSTVIQLQAFGMKDPQLTSVVPITIGKDIVLMIQFAAAKEACLHAQ